MIVYRIFQGTLEEIESEFNKWLASLVVGAQISHQPIREVGDKFIKEATVTLPVRANGPTLAVPKHAVS